MHTLAGFGGGRGVAVIFFPSPPSRKTTHQRGGGGGGGTHTQCNQILPRSLRSRYSAASINICTSPIAAIFNNNTANNKTIRGRDSEAVHKPLDWLSFLTLSCLSLLSFSLRKTKNKNRRQETSRSPLLWIKRAIQRQEKLKVLDDSTSLVFFSAC